MAYGQTQFTDLEISSQGRPGDLDGSPIFKRISSNSGTRLSGRLLKRSERLRQLDSTFMSMRIA